MLREWEAQGIDAPQQWAETHAREIVATPVDSDGNTLGSLHAYAVASYTPAPRPGEDATKIADAAIKALRRHTLGVLDRELERVRARHGCTAAAEEVEFALRRMVNQLLHEPSVRAKRLAAEGRLDRYEDALEAVFGIEAPGRPAPAVGTVEAVCPAHEDEGGAARIA